jgi:hypothetical protein
MSWISRFLKDIRSLDKSAFSITTGFISLFSLIGMLWALLGIEIQRFVLSHRRIQQQLSQSESAAAASEQQQPLGGCHGLFERLTTYFQSASMKSLSCTATRCTVGQLHILVRPQKSG